MLVHPSPFIKLSPTPISLESGLVWGKSVGSISGTADKSTHTHIGLILKFGYHILALIDNVKKLLMSLRLAYGNAVGSTEQYTRKSEEEKKTSTRVHLRSTHLSKVNKILKRSSRSPVRQNDRNSGLKRNQK